MSYRKRIFAVCLTLSAASLLLPFTCFAETGEEDLTVSEDGSLITGTETSTDDLPSAIYFGGDYQLTYCYTDTEALIVGCSTDAVNVEVPATITDLPVTTIDQGAFYSCSSLESVIIPEGVTEILSGAFYECAALKTVSLPDSLVLIDYSAFAYCSALETLVLPDAVESLPYSCFAYCTALESLTFPAGLTSIGEEAFYSCTALTEITMPETLTTIEGSAFYACTALTSVSIPAAVSSLGDYVFEGCEQLTEIKVDSGNEAYSALDGVLFNADQTKLIKYPDNHAGTTYSLPTQTTEIAPWAFVNATHLTDIALNNVTKIGDDAFYYCSALTSITIPDGVTALGGVMFGYCLALREITIPDSVTAIGSYCFVNCTALKSITLPGSLSSIGEYAYGYCYDSETSESALIDGVSISAPAGSVGAEYAKDNDIECDSNSSTLWIILLAVAAVVVITAVIFIVRKKRHTAAASIK